jgi:putative hemolysin
LQATPIAPTAATSVPSPLQPAGDYCLLQDGILIERFPFVGTDTGTPLQLNGSRWFCEFTGSPEADPPSSRISVELSTLFASQPTLAAVAYLVRPPLPETDDSANLAESYCAYLGGSSAFGGNSASGGGWASDPGNPESTVIGVCVFPDGSAIDDWGLAYNASGTIRGANLAPLLRYQPETIPDFVFPR